MKYEIGGVEVHASTGGRAHEADRPWIVFLHGAGFSHLTWALQSRAMAYDGWNVLAPDMPGHGLSAGEPIAGIEAQARWVLDLFDAAGIGAAVVIGHSMGGLIMLELARIAPERVKAMVFIATGAAIPVNPALIETAEQREPVAQRQMVSWAFGPAAHRNDNTWPGASHVHFGLETMARNVGGALALDLKSCAAYADGTEVAAGISRPTLCIFARLDRMTPLKSGLALAEQLGDNETIIVEDCGHSIPTERPREVNRALRDFLARRVPV